MHNTNLLETLFFQLKENPERSSCEYKTQQIITDFFVKYIPEYAISPVADTGLLCIPCNIGNKKLLLVRADMDAVTREVVQSSGTISYESAHLCGHHGHIVIATGLAMQLRGYENSDFSVGFLFQPAEETGEGAFKIISSQRLKQYVVAGIIGFHNLPGYEDKVLVIKENTFAAASCGIIIQFSGIAAHAAEPENSVNPAMAMISAIEYLNGGCAENTNFIDFTQITITHFNSGNPNFGLSPANGVVYATLRSFCNDDMSRMKNLIELKIQEIAASNNLQYNIMYKEEFPATVNNANEWLVYLKSTARQLKFRIDEKPQAFRWSEDFGHYLMNYKGFYFGFGIGENACPLHQSNYEFPYKSVEQIVNLLSCTIRNF